MDNKKASAGAEAFLLSMSRPFKPNVPKKEMFVLAALFTRITLGAYPKNKSECRQTVLAQAKWSRAS